MTRPSRFTTGPPLIPCSSARSISICFAVPTVVTRLTRPNFWSGCVMLLSCAVPGNPSDLTKGKLQALQVISLRTGEPIVFHPGQANADILSDDMKDLHTYGKVFQTRWVTLHNTAPACCLPRYIIGSPLEPDLPEGTNRAFGQVDEHVRLDIACMGSDYSSVAHHLAKSGGM